ncbi:Guanine nucleotide exchange factor lte1 [Aspergillus nanangensis]|uniref:Guanine nucleotide exchange factor lte1 n=1 Tax=Aspergillus nanangensis TaxID=2582783 RepID=A0AAD4CUN8_ASPNN|nr:Guanine nucleotide exchange factor lte1 [Aspergillus nanangensis]
MDQPSAVEKLPEKLGLGHLPPVFEHNSNATTPTSAEAHDGFPALRRAHTVAQGKNMGEKTRIGERTARERVVTSLLRVKSSHEALRKRSFKRLDIQSSTRDAHTGTREPNHFTVGNVGQNGKIFLRPIRNLSLKGPRVPPLTPLTDQSKEEHLRPPGQSGHTGNEPSRWSNSQLSELRPELIPEESCEDGVSVAAASVGSGYHDPDRRTLQRAHSFSTLSEQRSVSRAGRYGEYRILINRSNDRPKSAGSSHPALQVPIPTHHLGLPLFNNDGNTVLHNSIYSRTSYSGNFRVSPFMSENWNAESVPDVYLGHRDRPSFVASVFSSAPAQGPPDTGEPVFYDLKEPIEPSIFETLLSVMDDETVVRYGFGTKEISAATPARIVAQISSESFMDYELVSDFFLTFRTYLSSSNLLALLLARLQWAINRLQDDGRIIRIRTFAALRHWILNYFVDDFIPNYDIRVHFCDTINSMYSRVKARDGGGMSDLKILIDLKRCWYGRCSAYWEFQDQHIAYQNPDHVIVPGGDSPLETSVADEKANLGQTEPGTTTDSIQGERRYTAQHDRNNSSATAKSMPISAESDLSIQPTSCSLPPKSPKRLSVPFPSQKAPHPVPLMTSKHMVASEDLPSLSPIISRRHPFHSHAHKRSGSFSDSVRDDRSPISLDPQSSLTHDEVDLGSLIRGELFPPAESYMTMIAPPSPPLPSDPGSPASDRRSNSDGQPKPTSSGSGVKTIIGSIRRALHSRHGGQNVSPRNTSTASGQSLRGKTSALPSNVAFGSDLYRDRKAANTKRPARLDILCDEALRQYRLVVPSYNESKGGSHIEGETTPRLGTQQGFCREMISGNNATPTDGQSRIGSQLTAGSESIVIVDDTGLRNHLMSGAIGTSSKTPSFRSPSQRSTLACDEYSLPIFYDEVGSRSPRRTLQSLRPPGLSVARRSISVERGSTWSKTSPSLRLRKYASFQSGMSRHRLEMGEDLASQVADYNIQDHLEKPAGPTLRRRPGGDLRQMNNGLGLDSGSGSLASNSLYRNSVAGSTSTRMQDPITRPTTSLVPPKPKSRYSLIQTHSSQNLRRSFEEAIAQFAHIPDDDDGGIESTLLKLEGKWQGLSPGPSALEDPHQISQAQGTTVHEQELVFPDDVAEKDLDSRSQRPQTHGDTLTYLQVRGRIVPQRPYSASVAETEDSYSSIPLLERGLSDESMKKPAMSWGTSAAAPRTQVGETSNRDPSDIESSHPSIDIVKETESIKCIPRGSTIPKPFARRSTNRTSRLSGLSSELSVDLIDPQEAMEQRLSTDTRSLTDVSLGIPPHPLAHPPSPPMTIQNPRSVASYASALNSVLFQAQPLTPDPSPRRREEESDNARRLDMQHVSGDILTRSETDRLNNDPKKFSGPDHIPFILSCESQTLAQQLTLVEMAALGEVDWRDLVDMRWNNGSPSTLTWVQFLTEEERRGIDLVVGRFNLMVKWILSEIILTQDISERARTIIKFIHTAAHARRMCNYATMLQIAIALSSTDCSRLRKTWAFVSQSDKRLLTDMELLIQPVRNFHDLRVEMETANVQEGCIPFVGLYVHDLTYNAQKPAQVTTRNGEPLINFERYRTAAKIVKNLLRLIDASTKYTFEPVQGIIERCLWIASLPEEEIQARSKQLV